MSGQWSLQLTLPVIFFLLTSANTYSGTNNRNSHNNGNHNHQHNNINITAVTGISVDLRCKVKLHDCGNFYSIEWYRKTAKGGSQRVYVYRHHSGVAKSEGAWHARARHAYDARAHAMRIELGPTRLEDEGVYACEITYEEDGRWFEDSCLQAQVTTLSVLGRPKYQTVSLENGTLVSDGAVIGPYNEGSLLVLRCSAGGGRPIPEVRNLFVLEKREREAEIQTKPR